MVKFKLKTKTNIIERKGISLLQLKATITKNSISFENAPQSKAAMYFEPVKSYADEVKRIFV